VGHEDAHSCHPLLCYYYACRSRGNVKVTTNVVGEVSPAEGGGN
jgi:hypothetical protein